MKKIILGLILLSIIGIIPTILVILANKSVLFTILLGIISFVTLAKMLCE